MSLTMMSKFIKNIALVSVVSTVGLVALLSASAEEVKPEVGPAKFLRDHDGALAEAKKKQKPVFAFFQEVPG